ncbi:MAG: branched-chain amino acid ABC transporter permease [Betaproteobacteria bacterium]|nr:branched-chain amino acid ABC transporter permease [Betaproteobacteria bacterium]
MKPLRQVSLGTGALILLFIPQLLDLTGQAYYMGFFIRAVAFAIAAISLDLILGFGGMVSFGHAAYLGVGAYALGILLRHGVTNVLVHLLVALSASALVALLIGAVSLRTKGIYFIMITLAFSQMLYYLGVSLSAYGGDDGMSLPTRSDFFGVVDFSGDTALYYLALGALAIFVWTSRHLVISRFGIVIRGAKSNERRMIALGYPVYRYQLLAFVLSGAMCGVAGMLLANQALYVSPSVMQWTRSGELLVMVLFGGMGTLYGAAVGSFMLLLLEQLLSHVTEHWPIILGFTLLLVVRFAKRGLFGLATQVWNLRERTRIG